jgi:hypothetical protein
MNRRTVWLLGMVLGLAILVAMWAILHETKSLITAVKTPQEKQIDLGSIVTRIRSLNRLETASMRVIHVGTVSQSYEMVPNALGGDEITLYSAGDVIAGVDLALLQASDVRREPNGTIVMKLPPPMILVTRVDNRETHVINRKTGFFRRADPQLEGRARQYAEQSIRNQAMKQGILDLARNNGEARVAELLHTLGFQRVRFESATQPASPSRG